LAALLASLAVVQLALESVYLQESQELSLDAALAQ
jgi:hypothetical protein